MKLYYSPGACSTSCHITLEESGLKYEIEEIDFDKQAAPSTVKVQKLNPLGTLPILITNDGKQLDQNISIHEYIADSVPERKLLPPQGTFERAEARNWLSFIASDLHKGLGAMFSLNEMVPDKTTRGTARTVLVTRANDYLSYMENKLAGKDFLMGANFTAVDAYAFVITGWTKWLEIPLTPYKNLQQYMTRVASRPTVSSVLKKEGLT